MIRTLEIKNFKSIKDLRLDCRRFNVFIGEPNTGKSNILEALGLFSFGNYYRHAKLRRFVRFETTTNLLYDDNTNETIEVTADDIVFKLWFEERRCKGSWHQAGTEFETFDGNYEDVEIRSVSSQVAKAALSSFKFYRFAPQEEFPDLESAFLLPPLGTNLLALLRAHRELRELANLQFAEFGLRLYLRPHENKIEVIKGCDDVPISYPYSVTSDTLQRLVFHLMAVRSNKDSILAFEEPETHAFPAQVNYLAETIGLDGQDNQYFIATHNPYFLLPLLSKARKEDVRVFVTYYKRFQTKARPLNEREMEEILDIDVFSNIDRYVKAR